MADPQTRRRNNRGLPNEITHRILKTVGQLDDDMNLPPHATRCNTYTRFALAARQVSRLWRDIVDMCSCYWFRVSSTTLELVFGSSEGETSVSWATLSSRKYDEFQRRVQARTSMLAIILSVDRDDEYDAVEELDAGSLDPRSRVEVQKFLLELTKFASYQERILQLNFEVPRGTFLNIALTVYRSFDHRSALRRAKLMTTRMFLSILNRDSILETSHMAVCQGAKGTLSPTRSAAMSLTIPHNIEIPPHFAVTRLHLHSDEDGHRIGFSRLLTLLDSIAPHLQDLTARVVQLSATEEDLLQFHRPSIHLPSLVTMKVHVNGAPSASTNLLLHLDCPNLENVEFPDFTATHYLYVSRRADLVNPTTCLPKVKEIMFSLSGDRPFFPFEALFLPSLESLEFFMPDDFCCTAPLSPPVLLRLAKLPLRSLAINTTVRGKVLVNIFSSFNLRDIRYLYIGQWKGPSGVAGYYSQLGFPTLAMPQLQDLVLEGESTELPMFFLDRLVLGTNSIALQLEDICLPSRRRRIAFRSANYIDISLKRGLRNSLCNISTLITKSLNRNLKSSNGNSLGESDADYLFSFCPNLTALVFTDCKLASFDRNLARVDPTSPFNSRRPAESKEFLPKLRHIHFEYSPADSKVEDRCGAKARMKKALQVNARRQVSGSAAPLTDVTFSLCDIITNEQEEEKELVVEEFVEDGIICRIRRTSKKVHWLSHRLVV